MIKSLKRNRRGASMVEYAVLLGAITLVCLVAISFLGNKTNDIIGALAATLPGANANDDLSIESHWLVEYTDDNGDFYIEVDTSDIGAADSALDNRLAINTGYEPADMETLVLQIP